MAARHAGAKFGLHVYALKMAERSNDENYSQTLRTQPKFTVLNKTKWYEVVHCQLVLQIKCIGVFSSFWSFSLFKFKVETQSFSCSFSNHKVCWTSEVGRSDIVVYYVYTKQLPLPFLIMKYDSPERFHTNIAMQALTGGRRMFMKRFLY